MVYESNINWIRKHYPLLRDQLKLEVSKGESLQVQYAKNGLPILEVVREEKVLSLNSKYDPVLEAEKLIERYCDELPKFDHVFIYGLGLGYHVDYLLEKYPHVHCTIYEPNQSIFLEHINVRELDYLGHKNISDIVVEKDETSRRHFLTEFSKRIEKKSLFISLPAYERFYSSQTKAFMVDFRELIKNRKDSVRVNMAYEKRWTTNSLLNFSTTLKTPNILHPDNKVLFDGKPALIIAAGPSLYDELDNIRYIKENKLAYLFSVGSAINTLVEYGILPDAACTYDPSIRNQVVFEKMIDLDYDLQIPLIYGTSVGYETLNNYRGTKIHMLTNQDTISPALLKYNDEASLDAVFDSPSIAVITYQLLNKLNMGPIIFAGQNLAYKDNKKYSQGIAYNHISNDLSKAEAESALEVKGVQGEQVLTNAEYNRMRFQLERFINLYNKGNKPLINTTKGGAHIEGTIYKPLSEVIDEMPKARPIDDDVFQKLQSNYDVEYVYKQKNIIEKEAKKINKQLTKLAGTVSSIKLQSQRKNNNELKHLFNQFDKFFAAFHRNLFFETFIRPMIKNISQVTMNHIETLSFEADQVQKAKQLVDVFEPYHRECIRSIDFILPQFSNLTDAINNKLTGERDE